jgi:hypothetical protein
MNDLVSEYQQYQDATAGAGLTTASAGCTVLPFSIILKDAYSNVATSFDQSLFVARAFKLRICIRFTLFEPL